MAKRYWRCGRCGDIHYGDRPPEPCPTCKAKEAYEKIEEERAMEVLR